MQSSAIAVNKDRIHSMARGLERPEAINHEAFEKSSALTQSCLTAHSCTKVSYDVELPGIICCKALVWNESQISTINQK